MKKINKSCLMPGMCLLVAFAVWTAAVQLIDVQPIGPDGTMVGFASVNGFFRELVGVHRMLYVITDWLGLVPIGIAAGFGCLGLVQWIRRKHILKVDQSLLILGGLYIAVMAIYMLFEYVVVNYRPVWIEGVPEASYPSSTTMLVMSVMPAAAIELHMRIKNSVLRKGTVALITAFVVFTVIGRVFSGVHWLTDIIGGGLVSSGLVLFYAGLAVENKE